MILCNFFIDGVDVSMCEYLNIGVTIFGVYRANYAYSAPSHWEKIYKQQQDMIMNIEAAVSICFNGRVAVFSITIWDVNSSAHTDA